MNIIDLTCPKCGGELHISEERKDCYCEYCGAHLILDDGNSTVTNINIIRDEAKLKELEMEEEKIKRIESKKQRHNKFIKTWIIVFLVFILTVLLFPKGDDGKLHGIGLYYFGFGILCVIFYGIYALFISSNDEDR